MAYGHPDPDTAPRPPRYVHRPMTRDRAFDVAIAFGREVGMPFKVTPSADGSGFDATVPLEYFEGVFEGMEVLEPE